MADQVTIVTSPDDVLENSLRLLLVDLTPELSQLVSTALMKFDYRNKIICYTWKNSDSIEWLLDKFYKSNIVIFDADSRNQTLIGFLAASEKSSYFNYLKDLNLVNKSMLYSHESVIKLLENKARIYENY